jgi:osmoprotectant transport system ATP-binding protein
MITFENVSKTFDHGKTYAVKNLSLKINDGELLVLLGSSGCGKTTSLKMINRLVNSTSGTITVDGRDIQQQNLIQLRRSIGYVFQNIGLFPHMTIEENIAISLKIEGKSKQEQKQKAHEMLELVGLEIKKYANKYPDELSGGQQQRVGVARALISNPSYLLMDEPFAALDAITRTELQDELIKLKKRLHKTIIFVTHDILEAVKIADRIAVMNKGHLEQIGPYQELLHSSKSQFVNDLFATQLEQLKELNEIYGET